jgi:glycosyltransferase involved in cell wall biosynthesis
MNENLPAKDPAVSVIVPTYNRAHLLPRALDSILRQDFKDFEVIVIDDGSTDATRDVVDSYVQVDPRVSLLVQPENAGVSAARNRGMHQARGELIAFLDSDDEWLPGKLRRQVAFFAHAPPEVGLLYGAVHTLGRECWTFHPLHRGNIYVVLLEQNVIHGTSGVMLRRDVVARVGGFPPMPAIEDWDYWIRISRHFLVDFLPEPQIRYYAPLDDPLRKTCNQRDNLDARAWLYRVHGREMRRIHCADRFLAESARRHLGASEPAQAFRLAWNALCYCPHVPHYYVLLVKALLRSVGPSFSGRRHA